jgi:hypothetical protein
MCVHLALVCLAAFGGQAQYDDLRAAIRAAHEHRDQLLQTSRGQVHMNLQIETDPDSEAELKRRVQNELGFDPKKLTPGSGQSSWLVKWQKSGEKRRFDVLSDPPGNKTQDLLLPRNYRAATNREVCIFYDLAEDVAYLNRPPRNAVNPKNLYGNFDVLRLYRFANRSIPELLDDWAKKGSIPEVAMEEVDGASCVRLTLTLIDGDDRRVTDLWLDPQKAFSLVRGQYERFDKSNTSRLVHEFSASYTESKNNPGVWLLSNLHLMDHGFQDSKETLEATFGEIEVGVPISDVVFSFEGMGVPAGTALLDRRLPGQPLKYIYENASRVALDDIHLPLPVDAKKLLLATEPTGVETARKFEDAPAPSAENEDTGARQHSTLQRVLAVGLIALLFLGVLFRRRLNPRPPHRGT